MLYFLITSIIGATFGIALAYVPYGMTAVSIYTIISIAFAIRYFVSPLFRGSDTGAIQLFFFLACWITLGILFTSHPTGIETYLPPMDIQGMKLSRVLDLWEEFNPNVEFDCPEDLLEHKVDMYTITEISILEAVKTIEKRIGATHTYSEDRRGMSIVGGPKIKISIRPVPEKTLGDTEDENAPYLYDRF